jgi:hypothetical protein
MLVHPSKTLPSSDATREECDNASDHTPKQILLPYACDIAQIRKLSSK